jgi:hypothetical protein
MFDPSRVAIPGVTLGGFLFPLIAQGDPAHVGAETLLRLVPELGIAAGLFLYIRYRDGIAKDERATAAEQRKADVERQEKENTRRDDQTARMIADFKTALGETTGRFEKHTSDIVQEMKTSNQLDRETHTKTFDSVVNLTRDVVQRMGSLELTVRSLEAELRTDRRRSALPAPDDPTFPGRERHRRDEDGARDADRPGTQRTGP